MKKILLSSILVSGSCGLVALGGSPLLAQAGMPSQGQQPQQQQQQRPDANPGANNPNSQDTMTAHVDDKKFVKDAAEGGMVEVALGKMAAAKGASDGVKQFGQKMVDDHSKANDQLKEVASKAGMEVPSGISSKKQAHIDKLSKLDGEAFDKAYVKDMLKDHETDVHAFQVEAQNGTNPDVKQFAASTLPTLQEHLKMIKDLSKQGKSKQEKSE